MTSVDLSEFIAEQRGHGTRCSVAVLLTSLDPDRAARLRAALTSDIQSSAISRTLGKWGLPIGRSSVSRHRAGECKCPR